MDIRSVCVLGGSGFVGAALARQLSARGIRVRVITRNRPRAMPLALLPMVQLVVADPHDTAALARAFEDMDAVVNLVGVLNEGRRESFERNHVELPGRIVAACHSAGVQHLVHMSALNAATTAPSEYLRSKARGEIAITGASGILPVTIFRPSVIYGEGGGILDKFASLLRLAPFIPLAAAQARFQPIWVEDVARCFSLALGDPRHFGRSYSLCGPRACTLEELVRFVGVTIGHERPILPLGNALGNLQAFVLGHLPGKLITSDNLKSMSIDATCAQPFPESFGFQPAAIEAVVPAYLAGTAARARYSRYRSSGR